jgi:electron transfer flavoprotein alpha subunit
MDWAPTLAVRLGAPLVTDAVGLAWDRGSLSASRAVYGGKLQAKVRAAAAPTVVATVRPGSFERAPSAGVNPGPVEEVALELPASLGKRFVRWVQDAAGDVDITQADVLVSVGRGIGDKENLDVAEALAKALGATVSCSRPVVDVHWLAKERQVGISGKTVKPKVYIALGISGAFQHVTAMKGATTIIAVNKDAKAPIFRVAHHGIVGDLFKVVPALTAAVQAARA